MRIIALKTAKLRELLYLKFGFRKYNLSDLTINLFFNNKKRNFSMF